MSKSVSLLKKIKGKCNEIVNFYYARQYRCFVPNINMSSVGKQNRVLLSYSPCTLQFSFNKNELVHSNAAEITELLHLLIKRDCCVDVIDCRCTNVELYINGREYDYIIGFGKPFEVGHRLNPKAKTVFILTEGLPSFVKKKSAERYDYYKTRHGKIYKIGIERDARLFSDNYLKFSQFIIRMADTKLGLSDCVEYTISPTGLINMGYKWRTKDFDNARFHFVWFGSSGAIHKGLDILIDVFSCIPKCHLHVFGLNNKELFLLKGCSSNIHNEGKVKVNTVQYVEKVIDKCAFVILPSCSEAMSTGVVTNMLHGIIPIVSKECQFPDFPFGIQLLDYKCEYILGIIEKIIKKNSLELEMMSKNTYSYARDNYTLEKYNNKMNKILDDIISK